MKKPTKKSAAMGTEMSPEPLEGVEVQPLSSEDSGQVDPSEVTEQAVAIANYYKAERDTIEQKYVQLRAIVSRMTQELSSAKARVAVLEQQLAAKNRGTGS